MSLTDAGGPSRTTFSARSMKASPPSSTICLRGAPLAKAKSYPSSVLIEGSVPSFKSTSRALIAPLALGAQNPLEELTETRLVLHRGQCGFQREPGGTTYPSVPCRTRRLVPSVVISGGASARDSEPPEAAL